MKKLFAILLVIALLASNFAAALADGNDAGNAGNSNANGEDNSQELDDSQDEAPDNTGENTIEDSSRIKKGVGVILEKKAVLAEKLRNKYDECIEKCKGNEGEDCTKRCKGLVNSAQRIEAIKTKLNAVEQERVLLLGGANISSLSDAELKKLVNLDRARLKEMAKLSNEQLKVQLNKLKLVKVDEEKIAKKRIIVEENLKKLNEEFKNAKEKFKAEKKLYDEKRDDFNKLKQRLKECSGQDTEECKKLNEEALARGKEFLQKTADLLIEHLNKIKTKVESSENIGEEEASEIVQKIDAAISDVEEAKNKASEASTKEELQEAAKAINDAWKRIRYNATEYAARIVNARVGEIIKRSENLESKMQCSVAAMKEQGKPTDEIENMLEDFSSKVSSARQGYNDAKELLKQARELKTDSDADKQKIKSLVEEAKKKFKQAHLDLKEAHRILKEAVKAIKSSGVDVASCKADDLSAGEVYAVEDVDEETVGEVVEQSPTETQEVEVASQ